MLFCPLVYRCHKKCAEGHFGQGCSRRCQCSEIGTEVCLHTNGQCRCKAGYSGSTCDKPCTNNIFGPGCAKRCLCNNDQPCNPITGRCLCGERFEGSRCEGVIDPVETGMYHKQRVFILWLLQVQPKYVGTLPYFALWNYPVLELWHMQQRLSFRTSPVCRVCLHICSRA